MKSRHSLRSVPTSRGRIEFLWTTRVGDDDRSTAERTGSDTGSHNLQSGYLPKQYRKSLARMRILPFERAGVP
jgi:hypothetical protein